MRNRWSEEQAGEAVARWSDCTARTAAGAAMATADDGEGFALRLYTARLIGEEPDLVLHGGGNVSFKCGHQTLLGDRVDVIHVKGSGRRLATLEPEGIPAIDLEYLRRLRKLEALDDAEMVNQFRTHLLDASAPTPSIETLLHAFLPHRTIDHSHADAVLALANQPLDRDLVRRALGDRVAIVPYVKPGFDLARAVADAYEANPTVEGIVLLHHGLITFGDSARESYDRHIALVTTCEEFIDRAPKVGQLTPAFSIEDKPSDLVARVAPILRGALAIPTGDEDRRYLRSVMEWRAGDEVLRIVNSAEAVTLAGAGPLAADHLIHTKPWPLQVGKAPWDDLDTLTKRLESAVAAYRKRYLAYVREHGGDGASVDPSPRVVWLAGVGMLCWGRSKEEARITADIAEHTILTKASAQAIGSFVSLPPKDLYDMEFRGLQQAKLDANEDRLLERQIVIISGGAGAIGAAIAEVCIEAGAHVALADLDASRLATVMGRIEQRYGPHRALGVIMDVTDEASVKRGFDEVVRTFGGVDVVVPNAGIAHVAALDELDVEDFRRVMEVNATGYLLFMKEGTRVLKSQGLGGHIIINASKNVFGPGKDFGAYSASKAAGHQLGKVAAIELAPYDIRVNMINADAVFGDERNPSGLWSKVGPERAKSRGMKPEDLPDYYRDRNLLKTRVLGRHVGRAVVFFASNATPTTGATLPVDGGVIEAFPR